MKKKIANWLRSMSSGNYYGLVVILMVLANAVLPVAILPFGVSVENACTLFVLLLMVEVWSGGIVVWFAAAHKLRKILGA